MKRVGICAVLSTALFGVAVAVTRPYAVEPQTASQSGKIDWLSAVGQYVVCTWDSLSYPGRVELFTGDIGGEGTYDLYVTDSITGEVIARKRYVPPGGNHQWLKFDTLDILGPFVRGRTVLFSFTRESPDSVHYYFRQNEYAYGNMVVGGVPQEGHDLACRVWGTCSPCPAEYFGFNVIPQIWGLTGGDWQNAQAGAQTARLRLARTEIPWSWVEGTQGQFDFTALDNAVNRIHGELGCEMIGLLAYGTKWASTRIDLLQGDPDHYDTSEHCPPQNLYEPIFTSAGGPVNPQNYWARYVDTVVKHYGDSLTTLEIWNEPHLREYWDVPNMHYTIQDTLHDMCSLYVRLCEVATSVIKERDNTKRVLVFLPVGDADSAWRRMFYEIAARNCSPDVFWDGVAVHPYQDARAGFWPVDFETTAAAVRATMERYGDKGQAWITEIGWLGMDSAPGQRDRQARNLCETFVSAKAIDLLPRSWYDRLCWYSFLDGDGQPPCGGFGVLDTDYISKPSAYASGQTADLLVGRRLNGRILLGDDRDSLVRIYEVEDPDTQSEHPKTWVAWRNGDASYGNNEPPPVEVSIPTRTDAVEWEYCAYGAGEPRNPGNAALDGWFDVSLTTRPRFIFEPETATVSRPDLEADSVAVWPAWPIVGRPFRLTAKVKNNGDRATPVGETTWVRFYWNDSLFATRCIADPIDSGASCVLVDTGVVGAIIPAWMHGPGLLSARANPDQAYVEKDGLDDNAAYLRTRCVMPPPAPVLIAPPEGVDNQVVADTLIWHSSAGAVSYDVYLDTNPSPAVRADSNVVDTFYVFSGLEYDRTYYWMVEAKNDSGTTPSAVWSFTTVVAPPAVPVLVSPGNGAENVPIAGSLVWNTSARATGYDVYLDTVCPPVERPGWNLTDTMFSYSGLAHSENYYWNVVAKNLGGESTSVTRMFRTIAPPGDVGVLSIESPSGSVVESTLVAPGATVENFGPQAESIVVWFEVLDTTRTSVYSSSRSVTLLPDSAVAVVFDDWQAAPADSYIACAYTVLVNDTNPANDRLETGFLVEPRVPWSRLSDVPMLPSNKTVFYGGALANDGGLVYALKGNATKDFYGYDPAADTWAILDTLPGADKVGTGGALACLGQKLYALKGNPTRRFCGYDLNDNTWTQLADLPGSEPYPLGGALVGAAGKVFALKNSSQEFHAYDADSNTWTRKADIPLGPENKKAGYGTALTWDGATTVYAFKGNQTRGFYAYDPEQDVWARLPEIPAGPENKNVAEGGALAYLEPGYVFGFKGGGTNYYYCYDIEDSSWQACETIPKGPENRTVGWGGALSCLDGLVYALKGYSSLGFWVYTPNPVRPGQPLGGGVMSQGATSSHAWLRVSSPALRNLVLSYGLPVPGPVFIRLYDVSGRCVKQVCEPARPLPDVHACCLDARDLAAGVYVVHLTTGKEQMTRKVVLQK